jgi:hypothetical protein
MSVQLAQTRQQFEQEIARLEQGGYRTAAATDGEGDWRASYERERVRLAKLLVLYRDMQEEVELLRARVAQIGSETSTPAPDAGPTRRRRRAKPRAGPFQMNGYTLYRGRANRKRGGTRKFYFFAKSRPKTGTATRVPNGFEVRTTRSGLPVLRRMQAKRTRAGRAPPRRNPRGGAQGRAANGESRRRALAFAREMRQVRARARRSRGGKGPIESRPAARRLRAKYGYA